jgi:CheY-like chemotaxis protein
MRLLIIDDEEAIGFLLDRRLRPEHEIVLSPNGAHALARIESGERFDAILCDVMMPGMKGVEVYQAVAAIDREQARRFVFMSGGEAEVRYPLGRVDCLKKPFDMAVVREAVARFLPIRFRHGLLDPK